MDYHGELSILSLLRSLAPRWLQIPLLHPLSFLCHVTSLYPLPTTSHTPQFRFSLTPCTLSCHIGTVFPSRKTPRHHKQQARSTQTLRRGSLWLRYVCSSSHCFSSHYSTCNVWFIKVMKYEDFKELGTESAVKVEKVSRCTQWNIQYIYVYV